MRPPLLSDFGYQLQDLTIGQVLLRQAARLPTKVFLTWMPTGATWTYRDVERETRRLASAFAAQGWGKQTHVALMMENSPEYMLIAFALGRIGALTVPINTACKGQLFEYYLSQSDSTVLIIDAALLPRLEGLPARERLAQVVVLGAATNEITREHTGAPFSRFEDIYANAPADPEFVDDVKPWDLAYLAYTSGTTGPSKGNMLSQAAGLSFGLSNAQHHGYVADDIMYVCLPMFHCNALQTAIHAALLTGASVALTTRFSASRFLDDLRQSGATLTNLLGAMCNFLWSQPPTADDTAPLRIVSAVPVPKFASAFEQRFGLRITSAYGLSDFGMVTAFTVADPPEKMGSAGRARHHYEIRIADDNDVELPAGTAGEILVRTDTPWLASTGYYNMPAETLKAMRNMWFHTGDLGYLDEDGYLYFVDRKKDAIRRRGENVSAFEVQQIICTHPRVADAAVYPVRAETSEDEIAASVICREGETVSERELIEFCRDNMSYFMVPRFIEFRDTLPRSVGEKIQKHLLRAAMEKSLDTVWDREKAGVAVTR
ncbi:MAG: AMP-binding protein [Janthinobacterium lividum]